MLYESGRGVYASHPSRTGSLTFESASTSSAWSATSVSASSRVSAYAATCSPTWSRPRSTSMVPNSGPCETAHEPRPRLLSLGRPGETASGVANSALCIDSRGELAGVYRKTHLFGAEREVYVAGDSLSTIRLGTHTLGVICFGMEFPEVARTLAAQRADLLVTIAANPPPFELDHDLFVRTRALENGRPHVYVNRVGKEDGVMFRGGSRLIPMPECSPNLGRVPGALRPQTWEGRDGAMPELRIASSCATAST